jgi:methylated-DNA-protein-cysteine methyltransferase-like protein
VIAGKGIFEAIRRVVVKIPKGKVSTYGAVAKAAGLPGYARQVAWALRNPAVPLPWHRVIGAGGRISLPGEAGLEQRLRLRNEGIEFSGSRVRMAEYEFRYNRADDRAPKKSKARRTAAARPRRASPPRAGRVPPR